ncbi:DUF294 nucleotidyltransferase-like domain-containing protein [Marinospirillum alkaliphilum]|uniref:CBS domain-containing protein n=1 Tax=Marinospirillum alkaliphilum DSM 21637 TaxID=1122209 RepID=A0A1K1VKF6_9GAMM|nr:DUF294 nucleotidyltransferase-like domain-containing protein [Marinospirillum alkaliphilum]SFX25594.1 CBS domain-containing protein [Marinospirillum alkaliphilum DSM 21637]
MEVEVTEVLDFLQQHPPFSELPLEVLQEVASQIEVGYFRAGTRILEFGQPIDALHLIRSGSVEVYRRSGELYNRLSEGGFFGEFGLLRQGRVRFPVSALEDTLVYFIPEAIFLHLFEAHESFADAVEVEDRTRLRQAVARREDANELLTARVDTLISREPVTLDQQASVHEAAVLMTQQGVSCLLITDQDRSLPVGIITDKDLRMRVLAAGLDVQAPVQQIMTPEPVTIQHSQLVFEAMLLMLRSNLHHLPVVRKGQLLGVIALSDIIRYESQNSLFVVGSIFRQNSVEELQALVPDVRASFLRMVNEDANSRMIGTAMAVIGRSFKQRLLELAEAELGPPPIPYCFLALGSMAREEQTLVTDQDNALVLHDSFDPQRHDAYFSQLAEFVCQGLAACGYTLCKGDIMATNSRWRQPLRVWQQYFSDWIDKPTPETLLNSSIFFDLDGVWGQLQWADQLNDLILRKARQRPRFLACMARNALNRTPPLGFFKDFVMEKDGRQNNSINTKRRGTAPVADLIRVHALAVGSSARNSFERLEDIIQAGILPSGRGQDLRDALELISMVRIRHQALALREGQEPDNNVAPEQLSDFERKNLKDAFQILSHAQKYLKFRYPL